MAPRENLTLAIYDNGKQLSECQIVLDSPEYNQLHKWFEVNNSEWQKMSATYRPQKILYTDSFKASLFPKFVVVNEVWRQPFDSEVYEALNCD